MEAGSPEAGDSEGPEREVLLRRLSDSRRRFQRRMQQLIEKYSQPFEDDPLVQMATLTYETPQGLRIWGGKLIKEKKKKTIQDSARKVVGQMEGRVPAGPGDSKHAPCRPQVPRTGERLLVIGRRPATLPRTDPVSSPCPWASALPGLPHECGGQLELHPTNPPAGSPQFPRNQAPGPVSSCSGRCSGLPAVMTNDGPASAGNIPRATGVFTMEHARAGGSEGSDEASASEPEDPFAGALVPAVPASPPKDELRRKYLTQADLLLRGPERAQGADSGKDALATLLPSLALPAAPALELLQRGPAWSPGDPAQPASSPGSHSVSLLGASSQSLEADDICNVTISDLYAGMLHSMSRLLSTRPGSLLSTKTSIVQTWKRFPHRSRVPARETGCRGHRHFRRSPKERAAPSSEPRKDPGVRRDCKTLAHGAGHKTGSKLKSAFLEGNKHQVCRLDPTRKALQGPSLMWVDLSPMRRRLGDREDRLRALMWLISPVRMASRPRLLRGPQENRCREIEIQFNRLHSECLPRPRKQLSLPGPPGSWAVELYRGGRESPRASEPHGPSVQSRRSSAEVDGAAAADGRPGSDVSPWPEGRPRHSPAPRGHTAELWPGARWRMLGKAGSPAPAGSPPPRGLLGGRRRRYSEIKEEFDKLHQKCCQASPPQAKGPPGAGGPLGDAGAEGQRPTGDLGTSRVDSGFLSFQKLKASPPWGPAAPAAPVSASTAWVGTELVPLPTKRRRLSYSQAEPRDSPAKRAEPPWCPWEKKSTSLQMEEKSGFY
ncbi:Holliday junction recognition protein [Perognathus longimembris pacificus]|uniref:Holliday junction recognition protein n=1 Tax=Perognathus longimembris pacificus TaxID=214514 RepID=UPI00201872FC|nr:Holliday junction recognition protein [Perognathus longimembris pacificus]